MIVRGTDVSSHQGAIDWAKVAGAGYGFALARMTIGRATRDTRGRANLKAMRGKVPVAGAYGVVGTAEPVTDGARLLVQEILSAGADPRQILVMLDAENFDDGTHPTIDQVDRYARQLHALLGRWPAAYIPGWWLNEHGYSVAGLALANCPWVPSHYLPSSAWDEAGLVASKPTNLRGFHSLAFMQYTSSASIPGVSGRVDADVFYGSLDGLRARLLSEEEDLSMADAQTIMDELAVLRRDLTVQGTTGLADTTEKLYGHAKGAHLDTGKLLAQDVALLDDETKLAALAQQILSALQADPTDQVDVDALGQRVAEILHTLGLPVTIADDDIQRNLTAVLERSRLEVGTTP